MSHNTECLQCGELDPCDGHICSESKSIQHRKALQTPERMSDGAVAEHWNKGIAVGITDKFIAMNELDPQLERDHLRARANEKRLDRELQILAPINWKEIEDHSERLQGLIAGLEGENEALKARVKELEP